MAGNAQTPPSPRRIQQTFLANGMPIVLGVSLAKLLFHCYFNNRYGYFRDEFDYMSCGDHLAWGYVDPLLSGYKSKRISCLPGSGNSGWESDG